MADKNLFLLNVNGETIELHFTLGTSKTIKKLLGKDPFRAISDPFQDFGEMAEAILKGSVNGGNVDVDSLTNSQVVGVVKAYALSLLGDDKEVAAGESSGDTQQTAHV